VLRVVAGGEAGDDLGDEPLERHVPAVLGRVDGAVTLDHPAEVARDAGAAESDRARGHYIR
jgi:hypothetical protein